jgi:hypothetical protein
VAGRTASNFLRGHVGRITVVCSEASLWEHWGLHSVGILLFLSGNDHKYERRSEFGRNGISLGNVWQYFYCDRRGAHPVRSARGCVVELAKNISAWALSSPRDWKSIFVDVSDIFDFTNYVVGRPHSTTGSNCDLDNSDRSGRGAVIRRVLF